MNKIAIAVIAVLLIGAGWLLISGKTTNNEESEEVAKVTPTATVAPEPTSEPEIEPGRDPQNASYVIEGSIVTLTEGESEEAIPNSSASILTKFWGQPTMADLNNNDIKDAAVILTQESGGSGTFYYVAASVASDDGFVGTNGIFIGDRIAMKTVEVDEKGVITVNYADRAEGASMSDDPSEAVSRWFRLDVDKLLELDKEGNDM